MIVKSSTYDQRLEIVSIQFRLIRFALQAMPKTGPRSRRAFFKKLSAEEKNILEENIARATTPNLASVLQQALHYGKRHLAKKYSPGNQRFYDEFTEDGVNASELLVRLAHFEAFMKDVHSAILSGKPSVLAAIYPKKQISYAEIFAKDSSYERLLQARIELEVDEVDRQNLQFRADYFKNHFNITWCDAVTIKLLVEASKVRNELSHEKPALPVSNKFLRQVSEVLRTIPVNCCTQAKKSYPKNFG